MRTRQCRGLNVHHSSNAANDDLGSVVPNIEPLADVADEHSWVVAFVRNASSEYAYVCRPRLGCQNRLVKGKNRRGVDEDAFAVKGANHSEARFAILVDHWDFDHNVLCPPREGPRLLDHLLAVIGRHLDANWPVAEQYTQPSRAFFNVVNPVLKHDAWIRC